MKKISFVVLAIVLSTIAFAQPIENPELVPTHPGHVAEVRELTISGPAKTPEVTLGPTEYRYPGQPVVYPSSELVITRTPRSTAAISQFLEPTGSPVSIKEEAGKQVIRLEPTLSVLTSTETIDEMFPGEKGRKWNRWHPGGDPVRPHNVPPIQNKAEIFSDRYMPYLKEAVSRFKLEEDMTEEKIAEIRVTILEELKGCTEERLPDYMRMMINGSTVTQRMEVDMQLMRSLGSDKWCSFDSKVLGQKVGVIYFCANWGFAYSQPFFTAITVEKFLPQFRQMSVGVSLADIRAVIRAQLVRGILPPVPKRVFPPPVEITKKKGCGPKCLLPLAALGLIPLFLGGDDPSPVGTKPTVPVISPN